MLRRTTTVVRKHPDSWRPVRGSLTVAERELSSTPVRSHEAGCTYRGDAIQLRESDLEQARGTALTPTRDLLACRDHSPTAGWRR